MVYLRWCKDYPGKYYTTEATAKLLMQHSLPLNANGPRNSCFAFLVLEIDSSWLHVPSRILMHDSLASNAEDSTSKYRHMNNEAR